VTTGGTIGVGMLGYAFMGKAHSRAFREARALHAPLAPELVSLSGRTAENSTARRRTRVRSATSAPTSSTSAATWWESPWP
jgi:hypothetical protein